MTTMRNVHGQQWQLRESGPQDAEATVLMLPGGLCTGLAFAPVIAALADAPVRVVAATLPGFGRTPYPDDLTVENYAALASQLAVEIGADGVVGHSLGANVALEMAVGCDHPGPLLLLSATFSARDEDRALRILDGVGRVPGLGRLVWPVALKGIPSSVPKDIQDRDAFVADLTNNDPALCRRLVRESFAYFARRADLVGQLRATGVRTTVAFGDNHETGLTDAERAGLEASPNVSLLTVPDATHFWIVEHPERVAELVLDLVQLRVTTT